MKNKRIEALEKLVALKEETIKELERQVQLLKTQPQNTLQFQPITYPQIPVHPNEPFPVYPNQWYPLIASPLIVNPQPNTSVGETHISITDTATGVTTPVNYCSDTIRFPACIP